MDDTGRRFRDEGARVGDFADRVLVRCPRCEAIAVVTAIPPRSASVACTSCGYTARIDDGSPVPPSRRERGSPHGEGPHPWFTLEEGKDPYFGLEVALQTTVAGHLLWAWNERHLEWLRGYVGARLREREPGANASMASRLPRWMKDAKHRDAILEAIARLERLFAP